MYCKILFFMVFVNNKGLKPPWMVSISICGIIKESNKRMNDRHYCWSISYMKRNVYGIERGNMRL